MGEDAPAVQPTQKIRRIPKGYGRWRWRRRGDRGRGQGVTRRLHSRLKVVPAPVMHLTPGQAHMLTPLHPLDAGDQDPIDSSLLVAGVAGRVHLDLNEPVSGPSQAFMALGGTPPSATHGPGGSWEIPFMAPATVSTPLASPAPAEQPDEPAARGRVRRVPHCQGCGTGGNM
ncbi:hypothetical protein PIB30_038297 [Stylosanthes scabra]|uniref:Uncharacterized protein n=1 Tax=Stylosanthes scabra TaxID=79078 RepID=A0ABU6SDW4_9FABA|nr:hypothetical protein [Stylosanthes scabra]